MTPAKMGSTFSSDHPLDEPQDYASIAVDAILAGLSLALPEDADDQPSALWQHVASAVKNLGVVVYKQEDRLNHVTTRLMEGMATQDERCGELERVDQLLFSNVGQPPSDHDGSTVWEYSASLSSRLGEVVAGIKSHANSLGAMASKEFVYHTVSEVDARINRVRESLKQLAPDSVGKLDKKVSRTLTQALGAYQELGRQVAEQLGILSDRVDDMEANPPHLQAQHPAVSTPLEELRLRLDAMEAELEGQALVSEDYDVEG